MDNADWSRAKKLFHEALELEAEERLAHLRRTLGEGDVLFSEVASLLATHEELDAAFVDAGSEADGELLLGPYRLVSKLGSGGMGTVYEAVRADGMYKRRVAIKVISGKRVSAESRRLFEAERQTLARLQHPFVASLLEGGIAADGAPYLVMEYVDGLPVTTYCEREGISLRGRLALFRQVASAVHHCHQNMVVHCDIKPGNVLVTSEGVPKLLDFGIARVVGEGRMLVAGEEPKTLPWTPGFASPEQVVGLPTTTASDVYSLGALLHTLVKGAPPATLEESALPLLPADLESVVDKALRANPAERYASAEELSADLRRFLDGRPVLAHPGSAGYALRKLAGRHRTIFAMLVVLLLSLVAGLGGTTWQARVAATQRAAAQAKAEKVGRINSFLSDLFASVRPERRGDEVTVVEVLDAAIEQSAIDLSEDPEVSAAIMRTIGNAYRGLGHYPRAEELLRAALDTLESLLGSTALETIGVRFELGELLYDMGRLDEARSMLEGALQAARSRPEFDPLKLAVLLNDLGAVSRAQGRLEEAERCHLEALEIRRSLVGEVNVDVAQSLNNLAGVYTARREFEAAEELCRESLEQRAELLDPGHPDLAQSRNNLAVVLLEQGRREEADALFSAAIIEYRESLSPGHPALAGALLNRGRLLVLVGDHEAALAPLQECLEIRSARLAQDDPALGQAVLELSACLVRLGRDEEAEDHLLRAFEAFEFSDDVPADMRATVLTLLVEVYERRGDHDMARIFRDFLSVARTNKS